MHGYFVLSEANLMLGVRPIEEVIIALENTPKLYHTSILRVLSGKA